MTATLREPAFIAAAETFAREHRSRWIFRALGWYLRCSDEELDQVVKKVFCMSIPENTSEIPESPLKVLVGLASLPVRLALLKTWMWRTQQSVEYNLETISPSYFESWFSILFAELKGTKRLTPRAPAPFPVSDVSAPILATAHWRDLLRLSLLTPFLPLPLYWFSWNEGPHIVKAYRKALSVYTVFSGHFKRYPCRHFITYADEVNHPARRIAFRQNCPGDFILVQNGERSLHPSFAYGWADRYFVFGETYAAILKALKVRARAFEPVGALCLNQFHGLLEPLLDARPADLYDVVFIDQGVAHNGLPDKTNRSILRILDNLAEYKRRHPARRIAYQLRGYVAGDLAEPAVRETLRGRAGIEVLENPVQGRSYVNCARARLVVTFQSTLGFEMMRLGRTALFVNYSGDATQTICGDERFQLEDPRGDYALFERRVEELLALVIKDIPQEALGRHAAFDGRVQERIAALLNGARA